MTPALLGTGVAEDDVTAGVAAAMLALGALSFGIAYIWNFQVIARTGATTASSVTYLTPLVAALIGVSLLGEDLTWNQPLGAAVVLAGVAPPPRAGCATDTQRSKAALPWGTTDHSLRTCRG